MANVELVVGLDTFRPISGDVVEAHPIHTNDKFRVRFGLDPVLEHEPNLDADPGQLRLVYAIAKLREGGVQFEVMTRAQVDAHGLDGHFVSRMGGWRAPMASMTRVAVSSTVSPRTAGTRTSASA